MRPIWLERGLFLRKIIALILILIIIVPGCFSSENNDTDVEPPIPEIEETADLEAIVHFDQEFGQIAPIHGVNNGPLIQKSWEIEGCQNIWYGADYTSKFNELQIPSSRTHGEGPGDMNRIWIHADENGVPVYEGYDPLNMSNYNFSETDERVLATMATTSTSVYWRLGYPKAYPSYPDCPDWRSPPDNFTVFAQAAVQVLKHYREGWNDGYYYDSFDTVEVWNEPYLLDWWSGTALEYYQLYHEVNSAVTAEFGESIDVIAGLNFGANNHEFTHTFLENAQNNNEHLDAVYIHLYRSNPSQTLYAFFGDENYSVETTLTNYGFPIDTPVYVTEWNRNIPVYSSSASSQAYSTSVLTIFNELWQGNEGNTTLPGHTTLKMAHWFAARSGLWESNLTPKGPGFTWQVYGDMYVNTPIKLVDEGGHYSNSADADEFQILAGKSDDDRNLSVLLSRYVAVNGEPPRNFSGILESINLTIEGMNPACEYQWEHWGMTESENHPWHMFDSGVFSGIEFTMSNFEMDQRSFHYFRFTANDDC